MYSDHGAWFLVIFIIFLCIQQSYPASTESNKKDVSTIKSVVYRSVTGTDEANTPIEVYKRGDTSARRNTRKKPRGQRWKKAQKRRSGVGRGGISGFIAFGLCAIILILLIAIFLTWRYRGRSKRLTIAHKPFPRAESSECIAMDDNLI